MITLDPGASVPLYEQLYRALTAQIRSGGLAVGTRLPGKRSMAAQLAVSVNTVDTAYQMLAAEGLVESRPRSGFVVQETVTLPVPAPVSPPAMPTQPPPEPPRFDLSTGSVDTALFPFRSWGRIQKDLLYASPELLRHGPRAGDTPLRAALADWLHAYRGVLCSPEQIVVGAGVEYLLGLLGQLFAGQRAAIENPGYSRTRVILENSGIACTPVDIDGSGLLPGMLEQSGASLCYVTPSHHFPTGVTMPAPRRAQLLRWAAVPGRYILEDDYDSEFRFDIRPLPSLQGMAGPDGPVIYLATFSKSLAPSIRIACMVLPTGLVGPWQEKFGVYSNTVSRFEQETLCQFLLKGYFSRHLARLRLAYKNRMEALAAALESELGGGRVRLQGRHTGLHLLLTLRGGPGERAMVARAAAQGVRLAGLSEYYLARPERCPDNTVILGYAGLADRDIAPLARALRLAWG